MKEYLVKVAFVADTKEGRNEFQQGQIIRLSDQVADALLQAGVVKLHSYETEVIWRNPYPAGSVESWKESRAVVMDCILEERARQIQQGGRYVYDNNMQIIESKITEVFNAVLNKQASLEDFRKIADYWAVAAATKTTH